MSGIRLKTRGAARWAAQQGAALVLVPRPLQGDEGSRSHQEQREGRLVQQDERCGQDQISGDEAKANVVAHLATLDDD